MILPVIGIPVLVVVVVSLGYGIGSMIFPLLNAAISEICPPAQLAGALGVFLALMSLGGLVAPYLTGVIVDASSSPAEGYATVIPGVRHRRGRRGGDRADHGESRTRRAPTARPRDGQGIGNTEQSDNDPIFVRPRQTVIHSGRPHS